MLYAALEGPLFHGCARVGFLLHWFEAVPFPTLSGESFYSSPNNLVRATLPKISRALLL
jgi:hypothetical protein